MQQKLHINVKEKNFWKIQALGEKRSLAGETHCWVEERGGASSHNGSTMALNLDRVDEMMRAVDRSMKIYLFKPISRYYFSLYSYIIGLN